MTGSVLSTADRTGEPTMHTFETPGPTTLELRTAGGHVTITARETDTTTVELTALNGAGEEAVASARIEQRGNTVVVDIPRHRVGLLRQGPSVEVTVNCPHGSSLAVKTESSDVRAIGTYTQASIATGSGDIDVDTVLTAARLKAGSGTVSVRHIGEGLVASTGSGDITVDHSGGQAILTVGSGDITIGELAGEVVTKTGSGDIEVERLGGSLQTRTGSGNLTVRRALSGSVRAQGASGNISIGIDEGTSAWLDVSTLTGRVSQELGESEAPGEGQQRVEITAHTVSGDLRVHRS
jgi:DUF4097 and DUF4098 domain-containing protein YvlB